MGVLPRNVFLAKCPDHSYNYTYQICHGVGCCVKHGVVLFKPGMKINEKCYWDILLSQQMLHVIEHVVSDNFVSQQVSASVYIACATKSNCRSAKFSTFFLRRYMATNNPEWIPVGYTIEMVIQQHEYELRVNKVEVTIEILTCNSWIDEKNVIQRRRGILFDGEDP